MASAAGKREPSPAFLYIYVGDADVSYGRALAAGAVSMEEPPFHDPRNRLSRTRTASATTLASITTLTSQSSSRGSVGEHRV